MISSKKFVVTIIIVTFISLPYIPTIIAGSTQEWEPIEPIEIHRGAVNESTKWYDYGISWSSDGKYLAFRCMCEPKLTVVNTDNGKIVFSKNYSPCFDLAALEFSPNGRYLAVGSSKTLEIFNTDGWMLVKNYSAYVYSLSWSPDGRYLVYPATIGGTIRIIDTRNWEISHEFENNSKIVSWSRDGKYIAYASSGYVGIIDTSTWNESILLRLPSMLSVVECLEWSPDSRYLVAGELGGSLQVWNTSTWHIENAVEFTHGMPFSLSWNPKKPILAVGLDSNMLAEDSIPKLYLIDTENWSIGREMKPINETELASLTKDPNWMHYYSVAWSPDGNSLAVGYKDVVVYTTEEGFFEPETETAPYNLLWPSIGVVVIMAAVALLWFAKKRGKRKFELKEIKQKEDEYE